MVVGLGEIWSALTDLAVSLLWAVSKERKNHHEKSNGGRIEADKLLEKLRVLKNLQSD